MVCFNRIVRYQILTRDLEEEKQEEWADKMLPSTVSAANQTSTVS